jgi:hypothetical protein
MKGTTVDTNQKSISRWLGLGTQQLKKCRDQDITNMNS